MGGEGRKRQRVDSCRSDGFMSGRICELAGRWSGGVVGWSTGPYRAGVYLIIDNGGHGKVLEELTALVEDCGTILLLHLRFEPV